MFHIACIPDWMFSWRDYWFATVSAVIGVLIGIFLTRWRFKKDSIVALNRRKSALAESIRFNIRLIDDALKYVSGASGLNNFPLDSSTLGDRVSACIDDFDAKFIKDVNWQRFQLDHITFKLLSTNLKVSSTTDIENVRPQLNDISGHLTSTKEALLALLESCKPNATPS